MFKFCSINNLKVNLFKLKFIKDRIDVRYKIMSLYLIEKKNLIYDNYNKYIINKYQYTNISLFLPWILQDIGKDISSDGEPIKMYAFSMFVLCLIALICFVNVLGYFISLYLINKYDIENKYPKFKKIIRYYEKSTLFFVIFEGILCILILIFVIIINLILCGLLTFK